MRLPPGAGRRASLLIAAGLSGALAGCPASGPRGADFQSTCTPGEPLSDATLAAGPQKDGSVLLIGGRRLTPAGQILTVGGFPLAMRLLPAVGGAARERYLVLTDGTLGTEHLRIIDLENAAQPIVSEVADPTGAPPGPHDGAYFFGLAVTQDGSRVYVANGGYDGAPPSETDLTKHFNTVEVFSTGLGAGTPALTLLDSVRLYFTKTSPRFPAGLRLSADEKKLYIANQGDGTLAVADVSGTPGQPGFGVELGATPPLGIAPYDVALDPSGTTAYVSLWGGQIQGPRTWANGVTPVDVSNPLLPMPKSGPIGTGKAAEAIVQNGATLYVAVADGDEVAVIDTASNQAERVPIDATRAGQALYGSVPNNLAVDAAHGRLYVANAGENAVQVFQLATMTSIGRIPTAWYPTAIAVLADGTVVIASGKGLGGGPTNVSPGDEGIGNTYMKGTLQLVPFPSDAELQKGELQVAENNQRPRALETPLSCAPGQPKKFPLRAEPGAPSPIEHVFLVVRENKTYDVELGDLAGTNGDPSLTLFGEEVTPNIHALARRFAVFDNFYSNAEQSVQGHAWTVTGVSNDYTEKAWLASWGRETRPLSAYSPLGDNFDILGQPLSHTVFIHLDDGNVSYHNYGEAVGIGGAKVGLDYDYPGIFFALGLSDVVKVDYILDRIANPKLDLETFSYIGLPNDHTFGTAAGKPTPKSMIADNDEATGKLIDGLSKSKYWASSLVIILEDDPSDGGDHVELHRSPLVVISPWVKRGYVSHVNYDYSSVYHTIMRLLDQPPMNTLDAGAAALVEAFSPTPDLAPYTYLPRQVPDTLNPSDAPLAEESARIDFSRPDTAPLGRILWKSVRGPAAEPPWGARPLRDPDPFDADGDGD